MARYQMDDESVVDTKNATKSWEEQRDWNGSNDVGRSSKSQWLYEILHRSRRGRYYVEYKSAHTGVADYAEWVSYRAAAVWLLLNDYELLDNLKEHAEAVME